MESRRGQADERRLDLAARAAWLYYIGGNTQDEIAAKLNLSRQATQRLVSFAVTERLITVRLEHPIANCMVLAEALRQRFGLRSCDVSPADGDNPAASLRGVALLAAERLERVLSTRAPVVVGMGSGRTMRAVVDELVPMSQPQHRVVGLVGVVARDGSANPYEVVMRLADRIGAQRFPLPLPAVTETAGERDLWQAQVSYRRVAELAAKAQISFVGIGQIGWRCPMHADGFVSDAELADLMERGAVGELLGWSFDLAGRLIDSSLNERITSLPLARPRGGPMIAIASGAPKLDAILGALHGGLVDGLVTDEATAVTLVDRLTRRAA